MALTQAESYADFWSAHRDCARPLSPADVWGLHEDREFIAPSRAHLASIKRDGKVSNEPTTPHDPSARRAFNVRAARAAPIAALVAQANRILL